MAVDFSDALRLLKAGHPVRRREWAGIRKDGEACWLELVQPGPDPYGREVAPQLLITYPDGRPLRGFGRTDYDLLAEDWEARDG